MSDLPQSVQQIAEVIGREAALTLIENLPRHTQPHHPAGRATLYVPKSIRADHRLVTILGEELAAKLVAAFGGEILYPALFSVGRVRRNDRIREQLAAGRPDADIAADAGITVRQLRNLKREVSTEETATVGLQHAA